MNGTSITYPTFDAAHKRVMAIQRQYGVWPSIHSAPGGWQISHDPDAPDGGSTDDGKGEK